MKISEFDFDKVVDRRATDATQYEELSEKYGRPDLLPLWIADMDFAVCPAIVDAIVARAKHPVFGYTTAPASFWNSITDWLRRRHGWQVSRDEIDYIPGVKKGLGLVVNYFTRPGDKVVIQPPVYHSFHSVVEGNGRVAINNPLVRDTQGNYHMDLEGLESLIVRENPRMLIVCNPHNPIGVQWDKDTLARVADICAAHDVLILSDEIYGDMVLEGAHTPTAAASPTAEAITITLGAPSKTFNIPGMASAWTVLKNPELRKGFFNFLLASEFDTPPVFAICTTEAAYTNGEEWLDEALRYIAANARYVAERVAKMPGVEAIIPQAGFGMWLDFNGLGLSHDELNDRLVNGARVDMSDGASFGEGGNGFMRLNIGIPRSRLTEGLNRIQSAIR